jgi:hypothetical protein
VSFPIPLKFHAKAAIVYRNEANATKPEAPCNGSPQEPVVATAGNLCIYRGTASAGLKETGALGNIDKGVTGPFFLAANGEKIESITGESGLGDIGILIVFRTAEFSAEAPIAAITNEANLNAAGSWAVLGP